MMVRVRIRERASYFFGVAGRVLAQQSETQEWLSSPAHVLGRITPYGAGWIAASIAQTRRFSELNDYLHHEIAHLLKFAVVGPSMGRREKIISQRHVRRRSIRQDRFRSKVVTVLNLTKEAPPMRWRKADSCLRTSPVDLIKFNLI